MGITRASEYAMRALIHLAGTVGDGPVGARDIAAAQDIPEAFCSKVLAQLVQAGLVRSIRGARGGYALAADPADITVLNVVEAVDGPFAVNECQGTAGYCEREDCCSMFPVWAEIQQRVAAVYAGYDLAALAAGTTLDSTAQV